MEPVEPVEPGCGLGEPVGPVRRAVESLQPVEPVADDGEVVGVADH